MESAAEWQSRHAPSDRGTGEGERHRDARLRHYRFFFLVVFLAAAFTATFLVAVFLVAAFFVPRAVATFLVAFFVAAFFVALPLLNALLQPSA